MKKILSLTLGVILLVPQPMHAMQQAAETPVTDAVYIILKGAGQATWYLGQGLWSLVGGVASVTGDIAGRAASDLGMKEVVQGAATGVTNGAVSAAKSAANTTLKMAVGSAAVVAAVYSTYWLSTAKTRQELKFLKDRLAPEIPTVITGVDRKARYRIFNWKLSEYPTAGKLKEIKHDRNQLNNFLNDIASDVINNEFKDINPVLCTNVAGQQVSNMHGIHLTQEAARQIILHIQKEKPILGNVLEALQGNMAMADVEQILNTLIDGDVKPETNGLTTNKAYVASEGFPIKKWLGLEYLFGLKGNAFTFNYAEEYKEACIKAGFPSGVIPKPAEMTSAEYKIVDDYMNDRAKTYNNKIKLLRGYAHYGQAARLYWNTYKKIHRLEAIENLLNAELHGLAATNRPVGQIVYIR